MYTLKIQTAVTRKEKHPNWEAAIRAACQVITVLFPQSEWESLMNMLDKSGEIYGGGVSLEIYDEKMEAWH